MTPLEVPEYLSPSSIETFQICPLKYKLSRVDHISEPPTEATVLGNYVHDVLEELLKLPPKERTLAAGKKMLAYLWDFIPDPKDESSESWGEKASKLVASVEDLRKFRWRAWWCVENWFKMENPPEIVYGGLETSILTTIEGVPIKGFVDRWDPLDDGFEILDYKTGKTPQPKYQGKKFQQLLIYATALEDSLEMEAKRTTLLFVKDGTTLTQEVTPVFIKKTRDLIRDTYNAVIDRCEAGLFEPTANALCQDWCSYKPICPLWN